MAAMELVFLRSASFRLSHFPKKTAPATGLITRPLRQPSSCLPDQPPPQGNNYLDIRDTAGAIHILHQNLEEPRAGVDVHRLLNSL